MSGTVRAILVAISTLTMITINGLANSVPFNGKNTGEISDQFDVLFTPAGYVFSIWGLIYLALIAFSIYQAMAAGRADAELDAIAPIYIVGALANSAWMFLWHYEQFLLTWFVMLLLLATLIAIYLRLDIRRAPVTGAKRWLVHAPFSLYLGWITVATVANTSVILYRFGLSEVLFTPATWTTLVLVAAVAIATAMALMRADAIYGGVLVWAFVGIAVKHADKPQVLYSAGFAAAAVGLLAIVTLLPRSPLPLRR